MSKIRRKEKPGSKAHDPSCRNHGVCPTCSTKRKYKQQKEEPDPEPETERPPVHWSDDEDLDEGEPFWKWNN